MGKGKPMKFISLFTGIGAPDLAWTSLGWTPLAFAEIERFPCAVLRHHFPNVQNHGDVTAFDWSIYRNECDVLVGGSPCQSFSVAGLRKSLSDDRGNLSLAFCKITHAINPKYVVYENVPGILSTKDNAFGCLLAGLVGEREPLISRLGNWPNAGMAIGPERSAAWRILDAQYFGVAQRRRRVFVISCRSRDGINPGAILFEPESMRRNFAPSRETGSRIAASLTRGADSSGKGGYAGRRREDDENLIAVALNANGKAAGSATQQDAEAGMLLVANCLDSHMGSGAPDDNAAQANHLIPAEVPDVCPAIKSRDYKGPSSDGDGDGDGAILVPMVAHSLRADGFDASEDGTGRGTPIIPILEAGKRQGTRDSSRDGLDIGAAGDPMFTLQAGAQHAIAFDTTQITCPDNFSNPKPGDPCHPLASGAHAPAIVTIVDSLRLQGYNYGNYGTADQTDAVEILSGMRREIGEKAFEVWRSGISFALQSPEVLQCEMHGSELRQEADEGGPVLVNGSLSCAEDLPARTMRKVRQAEREGRGSQGWELPEQFTRELAATLSRVPQPKTQEKKILFDLWKASKRLGLLQSALSAIEKDGKSAECTNSAPAEVQDLWGASAQQGSVRETLHADEAGKSAQIITSDKMRKEVPGSMAVRRLTPV